MANALPRAKQVAVVSALIEGCSIRSTKRLTGVHRDTICKLLVRVGEGCAAMFDQRMVNLGCEQLQIYNFVRRHSTLRTTPAMAAGVEKTMWSVDDLLGESLACAS